MDNQNQYTVSLPGKAVQHVDELASREDAAIREAFDRAKVIKRGRGRTYEVTFTPEVARGAADRFRDLADVERDVASFGDDADHSTMRACDQAADRIEAALAQEVAR